jgi:hypothetical protein
MDNRLTGNEHYTANNRNTSFNLNGQRTFNFHLGVLIFAPLLKKLHKSGLGYIRQWLVAVLLGCQNIGQSKELNYTSLETIIGKVPKTLRSQRLLLKSFATVSNTGRIMQFNAGLPGDMRAIIEGLENYKGSGR